MSGAAAADARARFGQDAVVSQYEELYRRAALKRPRPGAAAAAAAANAVGVPPGRGAGAAAGAA
jgi:hypothetical protein